MTVDEVTNISAQLAQLLHKMVDALQPDVAPAAEGPSSAPPVPTGEPLALTALRQRYPAAPETWLRALSERSSPHVTVTEAKAVPEAEPHVAEASAETVQLAEFPSVPTADEPPAPDYAAQKRTARPRPVFGITSRKPVQASEFAPTDQADTQEVAFHSAESLPPQAVEFPVKAQPDDRAAPEFPNSIKTFPDPSDWPVVADQPEAGGPVFPAWAANPKREPRFPEPAPRLGEPLAWPTHLPNSASAPAFINPAAKDHASPAYGEGIERPVPEPIAEHASPTWPAAPESAVATFSDRAAPMRIRFAAARPEQEARQWSA
jgi:hypothetical protein